MRQIEDENGPIKSLINNAGLRYQCPFLSTMPQQFDELLSINVRAAYFLSRAVCQTMISGHRSGSLVNVASQLGIVSGKDYTAYSISKAALVALTRSLAVELAIDNIAVNAVAPGPMNTARAKLLRTEEEALDFLMRVPLGRRVESIEVANAVGFLCGLENAALTGQTIAVDGGWTLV